MALHLPESLNGEYFFLCGVETFVEVFWEFLYTWVCSLYLFAIWSYESHLIISEC